MAYSPRTTTLEQRDQTKRPRPILTYLNGDTSWLLSVPHPGASTSSSPPGGGAFSKKYYHIVLDPWLHASSATAVGAWFLNIERTRPAAATDGSGVDAIIREIEGLAPPRDDEDPRPLTDAIFITSTNSDHLHPATLRTFAPAVPVFASAPAAPAVRALRRFHTVVTVNALDAGGAGGRASADDSSSSSSGDWRSLHPGTPLPPWLSLFLVPGESWLNYVSAVVWTHASDGEADEDVKHELLLNAPHGASSSAPSVRSLLASFAGGGHVVLALLAPLNESSMAGRTTVDGVKGSLALERLAAPRYFVRSHDMLGTYSGLFAWLTGLKDVVRTLEWGLEQEVKDMVGKGEEEGEKRRPGFVEVPELGCLVLE